MTKFSVHSVFRMIIRYCVAPATPVQPSLTVLPRDSTTRRLDTRPTGCSSAKSDSKMTQAQQNSEMAA